MAHDVKFLQTTAASQAGDADGYCPECGRPWREPAFERPHPTTPFAWRSALLVVVGLALVVTFGWRAAKAYQAQAAGQRDLTVLTVCLDGLQSDPGCPSAQESQGWVAMVRDNQDTARRQQDRALVAAVVGLLALGVGLGSAARRLRRTRAQQAISHPAAAVWSAGEVLLALACFSVLALYLDLIALQLSLGVPLTDTLLDRAADDALVVISVVTGA